MNTRKVLVGLTSAAILLLSVGILWILMVTKPESKKLPNKRVLFGVKTQVVSLADYNIKQTYPGRVVAREVVSLSSEVEGKIIPSAVSLKVGNKFCKGEVIIRIFKDDVQAAHRAEVSKFLNILAQALPDIKVDFKEEYNKWYDFFSHIDVDEKLPPLPAISSQKEKIYIASKNISAAYYTLQQREIILSRYQIHAPFNGVYTLVNKEVGSITSKNTEIAKIASIDRLELVVGVPLAEAKVLEEGTRVDVLSLSGKKYVGRVDRVASFVDRQTQRINAYILFQEPGYEIVDGQVLDLTIPSIDVEGVMKCNRNAISEDSIVYLVQKDALKPQKIRVVAETDTYSYIDGLEEGDTIVGESLVSPYEGMPVKKLDMNGEPL